MDDDQIFHLNCGPSLFVHVCLLLLGIGSYLKVSFFFSRLRLAVLRIAGFWLLYCQEGPWVFGVTTVERNPVGDFWNPFFIECCTFSLWSYNQKTWEYFHAGQDLVSLFLTNEVGLSRGAENLSQILFLLFQFN